MNDQSHFPQAILNRVFDGENNALRVSSDGGGSGTAAPGGVAFTWNFDDSTTEADPGSGEFRFDTGAFASLAFMYISKINADTVTVTDLLAILSTSDGIIKLYKESDPDNFVVVELISAVEETDYYKFGISKLASSGSFFANTNPIVVSFVSFGGVWGRLNGTIDDNTDLVNALNARLKWRSQWLDATSYSVSDTVFNDNVSWVCISAHTSSSDDEPGTGVNEATYWEEMSVAVGGLTQPQIMARLSIGF